MAQKRKIDMRVHKWDGLKKKSFTPEQLERLEQRTRKTLLDMRLRELRKIAGVTQASLAKRLKVSQGQISETGNRGCGPLREREACPWGTEVTVSKSGRVAMPSSKRRWMAPRWKREARKPPPERQRAMPRRASGAMGVAGC